MQQSLYITINDNDHLISPLIIRSLNIGQDCPMLGWLLQHNDMTRVLGRLQLHGKKKKKKIFVKATKDVSSYMEHKFKD